MTTPPSILWSSISRNDIILCEFGTDDNDDNGVRQTAKELLEREPTAGWEFHTQSSKTRREQLFRRKKLQAAKFHVYAHDGEYDWIVWVFACVYDPSHTTKSQAQSFLTRLVMDTENPRENDIDWRYGTKLACQSTFGPYLEARMQNFDQADKMEIIQLQLDAAKLQMARNIDLILERGEKLEALENNTKELNEMASMFKKNAKKVHRFQMWQNAKHGAVIGTAITAAAAAVATPVLIAIL